MSESGVEPDSRRRASPTESDLNKKVWNRVLQKRLREMGAVDNKVRERLVEQHCGFIEEVRGTTLGTIEAAMQCSFQLICSDTEQLKKRREAHERLSNLLHHMEAAIRPSTTPPTPAPSYASTSAVSATESSTVPSSVVVRAYATLGTATASADSTASASTTATAPAASTPTENQATVDTESRRASKRGRKSATWEPLPPTRISNGNRSSADSRTLMTTTGTEKDEMLCPFPPKRRRLLQHAEVPGVRPATLSRNRSSSVSSGRANENVHNNHNGAVEIIAGATLPQKNTTNDTTNGRSVPSAKNGQLVEQRKQASHTAVATKQRSPEELQPSTIALEFLQFYRRNTPVSTRQVLNVSPDKQITRQSNYTRSTKLRTCPLTVQFDQERVEYVLAANIDTRLNQWDPYWKVVDYLGIGRTSVIKKCEPVQLNRLVHTAGQFSFNPKLQKIHVRKEARSLHEVSGLPWGRKDDTENRYAIRLHMLPLKASSAKNRADAHLWPKGTFLELTSCNLEESGKRSVVVTTVALEQRKQESHDDTKWCGTCVPLNLNEHIRDPKQPFSFRLVCHDNEEYLYSVTFCCRRNVDDMYNELTGGRAVPPHEMFRLRPLCTIPKAEGLKLATEVPQCDEHLIGMAELVKKVSLVCPMSRTPLKTPVRSTKCRHVGCFDLEAFLRSQESVSFQRWRCPHCENFVSLHELKICAFTLELVNTYGRQIDEKRSDIGVRRNGTHYLLPERIPRSKRRAAATEPTKNETRKVAEVIEID